MVIGLQFFPYLHRNFILTVNVVTYGGTAATGTKCVFPFVYRNKIYFECTDVTDPAGNQKAGRVWCGTDVKTTKFGFCKSYGNFYLYLNNYSSSEENRIVSLKHTLSNVFKVMSSWNVTPLPEIYNAGSVRIFIGDK